MTASPGAVQPAGKPLEIKLVPAGAPAVQTDRADKQVLAICQPCAKGTVPNQAQTACGE